MVAETRILVEGEDLIATWFPGAYGGEPGVLLGPDGELQAGDHPRRVTIGLPDCGPGCCGELGVRIRRDGGDVVWDDWITPDANRAPSGEIRFDADEYAAELERADADRGWEWTGLAVVRLARRLLGEDAELRARFGRDPQYVIPWPDPKAPSISVPIPAPPHWRFDPPDPVRVTFRFDDRDPAGQAADLVAALAEASALER